MNLSEAKKFFDEYRTWAKNTIKEKIKSDKANFKDILPIFYNNDYYHLKFYTTDFRDTFLPKEEVKKFVENLKKTREKYE